MEDFSNIKYDENTASESQIRIHLEKCDSHFVLALSKKINISDYAKKIRTNAVTFEAWVDNKLIGLVAAYFNSSENAQGFITSVSTYKQFEGKGVGSHLIKMCIEYAKANKFQSLSLEVNKVSSPAIKLYHKYGFIKTGEKEKLLLMKLYL